MASKILSKFAGVRGFASTAHSAGSHGSGANTWKWLSFLVALPGVVVCFINAEVKEREHMAHFVNPEFHPYAHLRLRTKAFPWGDGNHSLFHSKYNALPEGYEDEE